MTHDDLARAICCPGGVCIRPEACFARDRNRSHLVDIHSAAAAVAEMHARAVHEACAATIRAVQDAWKARGPMSRTTVLGTEGK